MTLVLALWGGFGGARGVDRAFFSPSHLESLQSALARHTDRFEPATDIDLGVGLATEMPCGGAASGSQVPLNDRELLISTLDHKPMDRVLTHDTANLALEFFQTRHTFSVPARTLFLCRCFEFPQCRHGGLGGIFALAAFLASLGLANVVILSHRVSCGAASPNSYNK